ncbi:MAG TPA: hypothetical protein VHH73_10090 [Verrucomicrobiae bacterium]|nr:hypothetical protein [Verrucomicrobiae bacterium]
MMKAVRILMILFMGLLVLVMATAPGVWDSRRMARAYRNLADHPGEAAQRELEEARKADRESIILFELVLAGVFAGTVALFVSAGRRQRDYVKLSESP